MKKNTALKILNLILGILLINQALTGLFHELLSYDTFEVLHEGGGPVFVVAAVLHVILNWNWVKATYLKKR